MPDLPEFTTVDGKVISGRVAYNRYCKENNVTNPADYKVQWEKDRVARERAHTPGGGHDRQRRIEALKQAWEKNSGRR